MEPKPIFENPNYVGSGKLKNKVAIITGGDSGIGRAVAIAFAKEGADVVIVYHNEHQDATETTEKIKQHGRNCLAIPGDLRNESFSQTVVHITIQTFKKVDILVNNQAVQYPQKSILNITSDQLIHTFQTNVFANFYMVKAVLPYLQQGSTIINTVSITAYEGHKQLIDYSATKGADVEMFGINTPIKRAGQPFELAPAYVYLASDDLNYVSGQVIHINGGTIV
ncbi:SDR family oxidoreductase [Tepidibacillus infernus]|uniref:SDR family oxidoreductase n=1 Tax=Tepidibacillus infernus TaxID=1806172 RepID=UPI003A2BD068